MTRTGLLTLLVVLLATLGAAWQRGRAVERLPPDYDEFTYLPAAYTYAALLSEGDWAAVAGYRYNLEHPPLVKLLFAAELQAAGAPAPDWKALRVGRPLPEQARPAFRLTRGLSALAGTLQVALLGLVHPVGALLLALDVYHVKYTAQAYLEAVPGLLLLLSVLAFERALRGRSGAGHALDRRWLAGAGVLLGLAAAGKYPYGLVGGLTLLPFLVRDARRDARAWAALALPALGTFVLAHPGLWPDPVGLLWESVTFHWRYAHGTHVVKTGLPWYQPLLFLTHAEPTRWHEGVFATGLTAALLLPLAAAGVPAALRHRPLWAVWAGVGLVFLLLWPTKWPQYLLLVLPPLCALAGMGTATLWTLACAGVRRVFCVASQAAGP